MTKPAMMVAPRKVKCLICQLPEDDMQAVNAEIWGPDGELVRGYRARGQRAYDRITGDSIDVKTITRHADHIEDTWHKPTPTKPAMPDEIPVLPTDYKSVVDAAALLGASAMFRLEGRVRQGLVDDRDLVTIAKLGVTAKAQQEANRVADKKQPTQVALIFGLAGGHLAGELPEHEVIDVTPVEELHDEIARERQAMAAIAAGVGDDDEEPEHFDDLFD